MPAVTQEDRMGRRFVLAIVVWVCGGAAGIAAQTVAPPEGWVVLPVDEYRALRERAFPSAPVPAAPPVDATLVLPKTGVDLSTVGGFLADDAETANESRWTAFGKPNQPLTLSWKRKVDDRRAAQALRVRGRVTEIVGLGEDGCQVAATVRVE